MKFLRGRRNLVLLSLTLITGLLATTATASAQDAKPKHVYLVGDSIMVGMQMNGINNAFGNGWVADSNGLGGRSFTNAPHPSGIEAIHTDVKKVAQADAVVIELGTNASDGGDITPAMKTMIKFVRDNNKKSPAIPIYWVQIGHHSTLPVSYLNTNLSVLETRFNNQMAALDNQRDGFHVIQWEAIAKAHPEWYASDPMKIHPVVAGSKREIQTIVQAVKQGAASSSSGAATKKAEPKPAKKDTAKTGPDKSKAKSEPKKDNKAKAPAPPKAKSPTPAKTGSGSKPSTGGAPAPSAAAKPAASATPAPVTGGATAPAAATTPPTSGGTTPAPVTGGATAPAVTPATPATPTAPVTPAASTAPVTPAATTPSGASTASPVMPPAAATPSATTATPASNATAQAAQPVVSATSSAAPATVSAATTAAAKTEVLAASTQRTTTAVAAPTLAYTGFSTMRIVGVGLIMFGIGLGFVIVGERKRLFNI